MITTGDECYDCCGTAVLSADPLGLQCNYDPDLTLYNPCSPPVPLPCYPLSPSGQNYYIHVTLPEYATCQVVQYAFGFARVWLCGQPGTYYETYNRSLTLAIPKVGECDPGSCGMIVEAWYCGPGCYDVEDCQ